MEEYDKAGKYSASCLSMRFGGWNNALIKAGLKIKKINRVTNDELLENLKKTWDMLGRQPRSTEMEKPISRYNRTAYKRHFGSWYNALMEYLYAVKIGKLEPGKNSCHKKIKKMERKPFKQWSVSKCLRFDVFKRDNYRCRICGVSPANDPKVTLHVDHIVPVSKNGETVISNLQTLCSNCNFGKKAKSMNNA